MPGMLYHLYFGKCALEEFQRREHPVDTEKFMAGNLLPDQSKYKKTVHFYEGATKKLPDGRSVTVPLEGQFYAPDLDRAKAWLSRMSDPAIKLGVMGHLYLDRCFTREFLPLYVAYVPESDSVRPQSTYSSMPEIPRKDFFSFEHPFGLYRAYSECNPKLIEAGRISLDWIKENVPRELPETGFYTLDEQRSTGWLELLERRLENPPRYTESIFSWKDLAWFVEDCAENFVALALR